MNKILVVDDDLSIRQLISDVLTDQGMSVRCGVSGEEALGILELESFDLILLDIMMGGISGIELCRKVRGRIECPIIFISAKDSVPDIVNGLGVGADDYITKPFALEELVARVCAHLRTHARVSAQNDASRALTIGEITLDPDARTVSKSGQPVELSTREFDLLHYLMSNAGQTMSKEHIFRDVWGTSFGDMGAVAINIKNLRTKIDPDWQYIKTIWGSGYRFVTRSAYDEQKGD